MCKKSIGERYEVGMSNELERGQRLQIMLSPEELTALDNFRFSHRMPSRAAAIRELLRRGLIGFASMAATGAKSRDFGVLGSELSQPHAQNEPRTSPIDGEE